MAEAMKWYLAKGGKAIGPFDLARLRQMAAANAVGRDDLVCPEGGSEWVAATTVLGLFVSPPPLPGGTRKLVPCARCGKPVSDEAAACPHCGELQPKGRQAAEAIDGGACGRCGTFNLLGAGAGEFPVGPDQACRGCRTPLAEAYPDAHLLSEMERVQENARDQGVRAGRVAAVACFLIQQLAFPTQGGWVLGLFAAAWAYQLSQGAVQGWVRRRAWRDGFGDRTPLADRIARAVADYRLGWGQAETGCAEPAGALRRRFRVWDARGDFAYADRAGTAPTAKAGGAWLRSGWTWVAVVALAAGGVSLYRAEFSQYELGRKAGVQHVREMSKKGPFIRAGMNAAKMIDLIPNDPNASADWNAGFRAGFKEELERMYPEAKR